MGTSSRKVSFFEQSPAVFSRTADSGGIDTITASYNEFIKGYMDNKYYNSIKNSRNEFNKDYKDYEVKKDKKDYEVNQDYKDYGNISATLQHRNQEIQLVTEIIHPRISSHLGSWLYQHWAQTT